jgi:CHAT domain-containing protein/tetratricopeptide (TPR) repeat protein
MIKSLTLTTIAVLIFLLSFSNVHAFNADSVEVKSWQELMDSCNTYQQAQDFQTALKWAFQAEVKAKEEFGKIDTNYAETLIQISQIYLNIGLGDSSVHYAEIYLKIYKTIFKDDNLSLATVFINMGVLYFSLRRFDEAEAFYLDAINMNRRLYKGDHPDLALSIDKIAELYYSTGRYTEAEPFQLESLEMRRRLLKGDQPDISVSLNNLAYLYYVMGNYAKAEPIFREALEMKRRLYKGDNDDLAISLDNLGKFYFVIGRYSEAETLSKEALEMRRRLFKGDDRSLAISINNMAVFYAEALGSYAKAEPFYQEAYEMYSRIYNGDHPELVVSANNLAGFFKNRGRYAEAELLYKESLEMSRRLFKSDHPGLASCIDKMALFLSSRGRYSEAEPLFLESLEMYRRIFKGDHTSLANIINNCADFYDCLGRSAEAESLYKEALEMNRRMFKGDHNDLATSINGMAAFYSNRGRDKEVEALLIEALNMRRRIFNGDNQFLATSINNLAAFYSKTEKFNEAEPLLIEALGMLRRIYKSDNPDLAMIIYNLGSFYSGRGKIKEAEPLLIEALEMYRRIYKSDHPELANTLYSLCIFYHGIGKFDEEEKLLEELSLTCSKIIDNTFPTLSEKEKELFYNTFSNYFLYINYSTVFRNKLSPGLIGTMYNNQLKTKALLLNSSEKVRSNILNSNNPVLTELYSKWTGTKEMLSRLYSLPVSEIEKQGYSIDSLEKVANVIEKELTNRSVTFKQEYEKKNLRLENVQSCLNKNEVAIEIVRFKNFIGNKWTDSVCYAALILRSNNSTKSGISTKGEEEKRYDIELVLLDNGNELEQFSVKNYKNLIRTKTQDNVSYNQFWAKIAAKLKGVTKIYISPDGVFNQINLSTLYNPKTRKYLLEEIDLQLVTSTRDIIERKSQKKPEYNNIAVLIGNPRFNLDKEEYKKVVSAVDNKFKTEYYLTEETEISMRSGIRPLPGTGIEVDKISVLLSSKNWEIKKYTDNMALEEVVKRVDNPRILHIATHGKFLSDVEGDNSNLGRGFDKQRFVENPLLRSYLIFAGADSPDSTRNRSSEFDDGFLTAYEAQNLYLDKTEIVVLSACETGLGEVKNGEGVYGLQRAFIQAGAKLIIMSLWSVSDDATQELMSSFYKEWLDGKTKRAAFHEAQIKMKEKYVYPYYWGAFVMVGE